jgi:SAM-dependent methyltransferase
VNRPREPDWATYLDTFHASRPGITEDVLAQARSTAGLTPYEWVVAPVAAGVTVLDLACGSGPCLALRQGEPWIGLDRSKEELNRARFAGRTNLVRGEATSLPFRNDSFDAAVCSMALMLVQPLSRVIDEVSRVLGDGATFVFMMPGRRPLRVRDVTRYARLARRLGRWRLRYPNDRELRRLASLLDDHGLDVIDDARVRFSYQLRSANDTDQFVQSLYLPNVSRTEMERASALAAAWAGTEIGIPLRRITTRKRPR